MNLQTRALCALAITSAISSIPAFAATYVWTGGGSTGNGTATFGAGTAWDNPANWVDGSGNAVLDYPDDLSDTALINRQGSVAWNGSGNPLVLTPVGAPLTVGTIRAGSGYVTNASLQLQNTLTANIYSVQVKDGTAVNKISGNTVNIVGTSALLEQFLLGGATIDLSAAPLNFNGSGTLSAGYLPGQTWGLTTLGNSADDSITVSGAGNLAFFNNGVVMGPGSVNFTGQMVLRGGGYTVDPAGTVTGTLGNSSIGIKMDYGGASVGGAYGAQLNVTPYAGGWTHNLTSSASMGALYLAPEVGANAAIDVTASNFALSVTGNTTLGKPGAVPHPTYGGYGDLQLRSAGVNLNNVAFSGKVGRLYATDATVNIAGNFDSSVTDTNGDAGTISVGTSEFHFTGSGKTLKLASTHTLYDVYFDGSTTLLSDLTATNLVKTTGSVTGGAGIDLNLTAGADMDFGSGLVDIDGTLSAGAGSVIDLAGGQLFVGALNLTGGAYIDFFDSYAALLKLTGDQQALVYSLIGSNTIRTTGSPVPGFNVMLDNAGDTLVFLPEPGAAVGAVGLLALLGRRRRN